MSAVELAIRRVRKLSSPQARELLKWLSEHQGGRKSLVPSRRGSRRTSAAGRKRKLREWYESIRGTTDWEPARMPDDLVKPFRL